MPPLSQDKMPQCGKKINLL